ncbi:thioredoxin domain-containing protein [Oceanomicrobium pacificus]|uniref:DUF255 domain-containing protein n=1 Tax=Oceanomicrobium pacificus TaxID=2692916 RepID=A0A6B0TUU7_9RHOB|nr:DUF255 domain-containing protein [Oceanomicrobium pacificus]MXU65545.1 DUF255 domain-containing protein [Oceanomicrobium pacificus]
MQQHMPGRERDAALWADLVARADALPAEPAPRTAHWSDGKPAYINRLVDAPSPYLRQHGFNPVDWYPWGADALAEAARRDCPIFLSTGYATCHWCHVMEEESFDDPEVAELLNRHFVAIKLDREERPDLDQHFILATSLQQGHAGWPNSSWLLPDGRPFHTGTYFPKPHFMQVLAAIAQGWRGDGRAEFERLGGVLTDHIAMVTRRTAPPTALDRAPALAVEQLSSGFNTAHGGFGRGPQFPQEGHLLFLADHLRRGPDARAEQMFRKSLDAMIAGGLHDHVGGGFHRYTVDENWRTPHFEKMAYNQGLMALCLTEAATMDPPIAGADRALSRLADYLMRDLALDRGGFAAAEDADSLDPDGKLEEGAFYTWSEAQLSACLGAGSAVQSLLGLDAAPTLPGGAVIHHPPGAPPDPALVDPVLDRLAACRAARPRPFRDDKMILGWNGLVIRGLATAGLLRNRPDWVDAAAAAADALFSELASGPEIAKLSFDGVVRGPTDLTDLAWAGSAALALYDATLDPRWRAQAETFAAQALRDHAAEGGRYALSRGRSPLGDVLELEDGATPSGESALLDLLAYLSTRAPDPSRDSAASDLVRALSGTLAEMPVARLAALRAARILNEGDAGPLRYLAEGHARLRLSPGNEDLHIELLLRDGWHLQDGAPAGPQGVAAARSDRSDGPDGWRRRIVWTVPKAALPLPCHLTLCTDRLCLAPELTEIRL